MKIGDLVNAYTPRRDDDERTLPAVKGIITDIQERKVLFSEKYAITETETAVHILAEGELHVFFAEEDVIEVISE